MLTASRLAVLMELPVEELRRRARVPFRLVPDIAALLEDFARSIAGLISVEELRGSLTRVVTLGDDSIVVQSIHCSGGNSAAIPPMAVTLGMKDILASRQIRLHCAAGERHRAVFRITVAGEVTTDFPSTLVQGHSDAEIITDQATAAPIQVGLR